MFRFFGILEREMCYVICLEFSEKKTYLMIRHRLNAIFVNRTSVFFKRSHFNCVSISLKLADILLDIIEVLFFIRTIQYFSGISLQPSVQICTFPRNLHRYFFCGLNEFFTCINICIYYF